MAQPLDFKPKPLDLGSAFVNDLERAPREHTEALLSLYALAQEAYDHGWLDAARGVIAGAPTAVEELSKYARTPQSVAMMRNLMSIGKILASIDPEVLHTLSVEIAEFGKNPPFRTQKPSLWKILRVAVSSDVIRGAALGLAIIAVLGSAVAKRPVPSVLKSSE
jgi:uncharacterized protein YjgD (DUF1641 family)